MRPLDFVIFDGDSSPNLPAYKVAEAMQNPIQIFTEGDECEILSYYYSPEKHCLILDIGKKNATRN